MSLPEIIQSKKKNIFTLDTIVNIDNRYHKTRLEDKLNSYKRINYKKCWIWKGI